MVYECALSNSACRHSRIYKNGHNFATDLPMDVMFGFRVGFPAELRFLP